MALDLDPDLVAKWEEVLKAEGLEPLDTPAAMRREQRARERLAKVTEEHRALAERYAARAYKHLDRLRTAHAVWALHCKGMGRRAIAGRLCLPEKAVRLVLKRAQEQAGLSPSRNG